MRLGWRLVMAAAIVAVAAVPAAAGTITLNDETYDAVAFDDGTTDPADPPDITGNNIYVFDDQDEPPVFDDDYSGIILKFAFDVATINGYTVGDTVTTAFLVLTTAFSPTPVNQATNYTFVLFAINNQSETTTTGVVVGTGGGSPANSEIDQIINDGFFTSTDILEIVDTATASGNDLSQLNATISFNITSAFNNDVNKEATTYFITIEEGTGEAGDLDEIDIVFQSFGDSGGPTIITSSGAVPEPGTVALVSLGFVVVGMTRRPRMLRRRG